MKDRGVRILGIYYFIYFVYTSCSAFTSKYMAEVGITNAQVGLLTTLPALISMCFMPIGGAISDRSSKKKYLLIICSVIASGLFLLVDGFTNWDEAAKGAALTTRFAPYLTILTVTSVILQPAMPTMTSISMEYTASIGESNGPVRMMGTIGYQLGLLLIGFILSMSLRHLYTLSSAALLLSTAVALFLPNVVGHQHGKEKVSPFAVFKDRRMVWLLFIIFVGSITSMFYVSFFGVYLEDMHVSNRFSSFILTFSVLLEIPLFFFSHKLVKLLTVWQWIFIAFIANGIRYFGFFMAMRLDLIWLIFVSQIPAVTVAGCFEYFPALYISRIIDPKLSSSAQTILNISNFGISKIIGSLLAGLLCEKIGTGNMFLVNSLLLFVSGMAFLPVIRKLSREEKNT